MKDLPTKHCKSENSGLKSSMRSGEKGNNRKPWSTENIPSHSESNVVNSATTDMYRGSDKLLHYYTANEADEEREQRLPTVQEIRQQLKCI